MPQILKDTFLYFSAFVPMYFLIQVKFLADLAFGNVEANAFTICVLCFLALLIVLGILGLFWSIKWHKGKSESIIIKRAHNITDQHFLGYFSIFILFALSFDLSKVSMFAAFLFITFFVGIVYVRNKLFYINPFLNILGFSFYEVTYITHAGDGIDSNQCWAGGEYNPVKQNDTEQKVVKIFYRGKLEVSDKPYKVKLKNAHFSFVEKCK